MFQHGQWDDDTVNKLFALSYYIQKRTLIARCTFRIHLVTVSGHMFCEHQFYMHANDLLGFDVKACLQAALENKACRLIALIHANSSKPAAPTGVTPRLHAACSAASLDGILSRKCTFAHWCWSKWIFSVNWSFEVDLSALLKCGSPVDIQMKYFQKNYIKIIKIWCHKI